MKGRFAAVLVAWMAGWTATAQNETDALRFSHTAVPGTARSLGMGGAFGALGADLSSYWLNPGGIGLYRRGGIEISLGMGDQSAASTYMGSQADNGRSRFFVQSLGISSSRLIRDSRWKAYTLGVAYGRQQNFNEYISIRGEATGTSLLESFVLQANGTAPADLTDAFPFGAGLAWQTYLINPLDETASTYVPAATGRVEQSAVIERSGGMSETAFGGGLNYMDWLYLGASVGFHSITYAEESVYREAFPESADLADYSFTQDLSVTGTGVGVKLGAVARATPWLRLGAAWHSRVRFGVSDNYSALMASRFRNEDGFVWESPRNVSTYGLGTPARWLASAGFILGEFGAVAADYEYVDFRGMRMHGTDLNTYDFEAENEAIGLLFRGVHRVRAGVEIRPSHPWRLRAGASYAQSPYVKGANSNSALIGLSGGAGFRYEAFTADLALSWAARTEDYFLYNPQLVEAARMDITRLNILLSAGVRF